MIRVICLCQSSALWGIATVRHAAFETGNDMLLMRGAEVAQSPEQLGEDDLAREE